MQASEGDILEVSGSKRKNLPGRLFGNLFDDQSELQTDKIDKVDGADQEKKAKNKQAGSNSSLSDCDMADDDFFYQQLAGPHGGSMVKLNPQEEEDLIRELENETMKNDTLKGLDEALMDRNTA